MPFPAGWLYGSYRSEFVIEKDNDRGALATTKLERTFINVGTIINDSICTTYLFVIYIYCTFRNMPSMRDVTRTLKLSGIVIRNVNPKRYVNALNLD